MRASLLILRSLRKYWKSDFLVALGVAIATAVITGSLLVGDSVTASVHRTVLSRLGRITHVLQSQHLVREGLVGELRESLHNSAREPDIAAVLSVQGTARNVATEVIVPRVEVIGIDERFTGLFSAHNLSLEGREAAVNATLARDLDLEVGDFIVVNVRRREQEPEGTLFARRGDRDIMGRMRLHVAVILADEDGGAFSPARTTAQPRNVFVSIEWLASELDEPGKINMILSAADETDGETLQAALNKTVIPNDYGLSLVDHGTAPLFSVYNHYLVFMPDHVPLIQGAAERIEGVKTARTSIYLADTIRNNISGKEAAYVVVAGMEELDPLPVLWGAKTLGDTDIILNRWLAEDLGAAIGDEMELRYLVSRPDGSYQTETFSLTTRGIVALDGPAADPKLVPDFRGITDAVTVTDWDPPFPLDLDRVTKRDDEYWDLHRATPKAYLSLHTLRKMWQAGQPAERETGWITSIRINPPDGMDLKTFHNHFTVALREEMTPLQAGLRWQPVRALAIDAAAGSQDYGMLFTSMSFFIVLSAMGLVGMLMRLSMQQRASQLGVMYACGFTERRATAILFGEGFILVLAGTIAGIPLGVMYAAGMIALLRSGFLGGIGEVELWLFMHPVMPVIGALSGLLAGLLATWLGIRGLKRAATLELLAGWQAMNTMPRKVPYRTTLLLAMLSLVAVFWSMRSGLTAGFFLTGFLLLATFITACKTLLSFMAAKARRGNTNLTITLLAARGAALNLGRSILVISLLAAATFVVTAVSAFTRDYARIDVTDRHAGTGGFALRAVSSIPLPYELGSATGREALGFGQEDEALFAEVEVHPFLINDGDDVSCLNLARPDTPVMLGVAREMVARGGFSVRTNLQQQNPWELLESELPEGRIPVFGDSDSVRWQLHMDIGAIMTVTAPDGTAVELEIIGLINHSIFAGELLMSESNFRGIYPGESRPRYFLIDTPAEKSGAIAEALRRNLGEMGFDVRATNDLLNEIVGVQNTYISTFIALGGLGIILGTFGLVVVLLRSAIERREEEALQLALGFPQAMPAKLLALENGGLLIAGIACGLLAAWPAVLLQMKRTAISINWLVLLPILTFILIIGLAACLLAAKMAVKGDLIPLLRGE